MRTGKLVKGPNSTTRQKPVKSPLQSWAYSPHAEHPHPQGAMLHGGHLEVCNAISPAFLLLFCG